MKKSLAEVMQMQPKAIGPDSQLNGWGQVPYAQLSIILVHLRFLGMLHQTHHWIAKGDPFFGDHKLYEQLYDTVVKEVDDVAEKAVGLGTEENVCLGTALAQMHQLAEQYLEDGVPTPESLAKKSLECEVAFIKLVEYMCLSMRNQGTCTDGMQNMLNGICDVHERHVYLLKRRCMSSASGM